MPSRSTIALLALVGCGPPPPTTGAVSLTVTPEDATVAVAETTGTGRLDAELLAGEHRVHLERTGFAPLDATITVVAGQPLAVTYALEPLPQPVHLVTWPEGATVTAGETVLGVTPLDLTVPSGPWHAEIRLDGHEHASVDTFVDAPLSREWWLDREGQLLDLQRVIPTGPEPKGVAVHPDGRQAWVTCLDGPPSVTIHDLTTGERIGAITLGEHGAVEIAFSADGATAWVSQMETHKVYEIDVATRAVKRVLDTRSYWSKVVIEAPDGHAIYVSNWLGADVSEIDLVTGDVRKLPTVAIPRGLYATPDGAAVYAASFETGELARIELATGTSEVVFSGGKNLRHLVGDASRGRLYVSDMGMRVIWVHDLKTGETRKLADTDHNANTIDLSSDGLVLFVSCRGKNGAGGYLTVGDRGSVLAIDTETGAVLDAIAAGDQPTALDVSPDGELLVFSDFRNDRLQVFAIPDTATLRAGGGGRVAVYRDELKR